MMGWIVEVGGCCCFILMYWLVVWCFCGCVVMWDGCVIVVGLVVVICVGSYFWLCIVVVLVCGCSRLGWFWYLVWMSGCLCWLSWVWWCFCLYLCVWYVGIVVCIVWCVCCSVVVCCSRFFVFMRLVVGCCWLIGLVVFVCWIRL